MFQNKRTKPNRIIILGGTVLFFCLALSPAFAAAPTNGTIAPSSGTGQVDVAQLFTTTFSDADGWQNIQYLYFLVSTSSSTLTNCLYAYYNQNTNKLYLRNNGNTAWVGGYAPGSNNTIENSYARLYCASTTFSGSGNTLTVNWSVSFKSTFTGSKKTYLYVRDDTNAYQNWTQKGTWTIQGSVSDTTPPSGSIQINNNAAYTNSTAVTLKLSATDSGSGMGAGAQMQFSYNNSTWSVAENYAASKNWTLASGDGTKNVYVKYKDVAGNWSGAFSDSIILDTVAPSLPTIIPPVSPTTSNSSTLNGTKSTDAASIIVTCATATVGTVSYPTSTTWSCQLTNLSPGLNSISVKAKDAANNESLSVLTSITYNTSNRAPSVGTVMPFTGTVQTQTPITFNTTYTDFDGWQNLREAYLLINTSTSGANCVYLYYNQDANLLYLRNDADTAWVGGFTPGSANTIQNSYASLDCSKTSIAPNNTILQVNWNVTLKSTFTGARNEYLYVKDDANAFAGWTQAGSLTIQPGSVIPTVTDDGKYASSLTSLHAKWSTTDTDIVEYQYGIGSGFPGGTEVTGWVSTTAKEVTVTGLTLQVGATYYFNVKAKNSSGIWSPVGSSDGITIDKAPEIYTSTPADKSVAVETDSVPCYACVNFQGADKQEFQVSLDGTVMQPWIESTTSCTYNSLPGICLNYAWQTKSGDKGYHKLKIEARDNRVGPVSTEANVYIVRKPSGPP